MESVSTRVHVGFAPLPAAKGEVKSEVLSASSSWLQHCRAALEARWGGGVSLRDRSAAWLQASGVLRATLQACLPGSPGSRTGLLLERILHALRPLPPESAAEAAGDGRVPAECDLGNLDPADVAAFSSETWAALAEVAAQGGLRLQALRLPSGLRDLPQGLSRLGDLRELDLPGFRGNRLDTRALDRPGQPLTVRLGANAATTEIHHAARHEVTVVPTHRRKVRLHAPAAEGGPSAPRKLKGHAYYRESKEFAHLDPDQVARSSFNCKAKVMYQRPDGGTAQRPALIVCAHLAVDWITRRRQHQDGSPAAQAQGRFSYASRASVDAIASAFAHQDLNRHDAIRASASLAHYVDDTCMGAFLKEQFAAMAPGQTRHFLFNSSNHAMALELRRKPPPDSSGGFTLNFFDPNRTITHLHMEFDGLANVRCGFTDLMEPDAIKSYFNQGSGGLLAEVIEVGAGMTDGKPPLPAAGPRETRVWAARHEPGTWAMQIAHRSGSQRLDGGFIAAAKDALTSATITPEERLRALSPTHALGMTPLQASAIQGRTSAMQSLMDLALDERMGLAGGQRLRWLQARNDWGEGALAAAIRVQQPEAATLLLNRAMAPATGLSPQQQLEFLATADGTGETALHEAVRGGDAPAVRQLLEAALGMPQPHGGEAIVHLLTRRDSKREMPLTLAMKGGSSDVVDALTSAILDPRAGLSRQQVHELLGLPPVYGTPLYAVVESGGKLAQHFLNKLASAEVGLTGHDWRRVLLGPWDGDGLLHLALKKNHSEVAGQLVRACANVQVTLPGGKPSALLLLPDHRGKPALELLITGGAPLALLRGLLDADSPTAPAWDAESRRAFLLARNANGRTALSRAINENRLDVARALTNWVAGLELDERARVKWLRDEDAQKQPAWKVALKAGGRQTAQELLDAMLGPGSGLDSGQQFRAMCGVKDPGPEWSADTDRPLITAYRTGDPEAVRLVVRAILGSGMTGLQKARLLSDDFHTRSKPMRDLADDEEMRAAWGQAIAAATPLQLDESARQALRTRVPTTLKTLVPSAPAAATPSSG